VPTACFISSALENKRRYNFYRFPSVTQPRIDNIRVPPTNPDGAMK
jgi:hypothetical protein